MKILNIANFQPKFKTPKMQQTSYQSKPAISFQGETNIPEKAAPKIRAIVDELFGINFTRTEDKFISEDYYSLEAINNISTLFKKTQEEKLQILNKFKDETQVGLFTKVADELLTLDRLIFLGAESKTALGPGKDVLGSQFALLVDKQSNKIKSGYISNEMKKILKEKFAQNNGKIKVKYGNEKFILRQQLLEESDPSSPMRFLIIEKDAL